MFKAYVVCYCYRIHALKEGLDQQRAIEQLNGVANDVMILRLAIANKELPASTLSVDDKLAYRSKREEKRREANSKRATNIKQKEKEVEENKVVVEEGQKRKERQFEDYMTKREEG